MEDDNLCPILRQCMKTPYKWWLSSTVTMIPALLVILVSIHWLSFSGLNLMPKLPWNILGQLPIVVMVTVLQLVPCPHLTVISQPTLKMTVRKKKSWASLHPHCQTLPTNPASAQLIGKIRDSFFHFICILIRIYLWGFTDLIHSFPTLEFWRSSSRRMVDSHHMYMMGRGG